MRMGILCIGMLVMGGCSRNDLGDAAPDAAVDQADDGREEPPPVDLLLVEHTVYWAQELQLVASARVATDLVTPLVTSGVDVRVGVLSADLGSAGTVFPDDERICGGPCDREDGSTSSDLGRLLTHPTCWRVDPTVGLDLGVCASVVTPDGSVPPYLAGSDPRLGDWLACLLIRGDGCPIPQPLESLALAQESGTNPGFLRDGSVLVVVVVADGDDCSIADPRVFAEDGPIVPVGFRSQCAYWTDHVHPVSRYTESLLRVRPVDRLVVAAFAGVPQDYPWCDPAHPDPDCGDCVAERPYLCYVGCASPPGRIVSAAPRLRDFARSFGTTADGSPVGFSFGSCTLLPGAVDPTPEEAWAAVREAVLDRVGLAP